MRQMGAELVHADGWTDMTKLIVAFCNFSNAPNKRTAALLPGLAATTSASYTVAV
jgi:hypothetical protein